MHDCQLYRRQKSTVSAVGPISSRHAFSPLVFPFNSH